MKRKSKLFMLRVIESMKGINDICLKELIKKNLKISEKGQICLLSVLSTRLILNYSKIRSETTSLHV